MNILHTEASMGWGGQEMRILREAIGLRGKGHKIFFAVAKGAKLAERARLANFPVFEMSFKKKSALKTIRELTRLIKDQQISILNTHSSSDSWIAGMAGRISGAPIIRTRHLSTPIGGVCNAWLLYNKLADCTVTTSSGIIPMICKKAKLIPSRCLCIPTGVDPGSISFSPGEDRALRAKWQVPEEGIIIGTACIVRSWKGIYDFLEAASLLKEDPRLHFVVVGGGYVEQYQEAAKKRGLNKVHFTGHLENPYPAINAMDIFALLSTANEGISQAGLQAAYLKKPLIMTKVGGSPEICKEMQTGLLVDPYSPVQIAEKINYLAGNPTLRRELGENGNHLVQERFTFKETLSAMEQVFSAWIKKK